MQWHHEPKNIIYIFFAVFGVQQPKRLLEGSKAFNGDLLSKSPSDSLMTLLLPFKSDAELRDEYVNSANQVRVAGFRAVLQLFC